MQSKDRRRALQLAAAALLVVSALTPAAAALDVSTKAIKVVENKPYESVVSYSRTIESLPGGLDGSGTAIAVLDTGVDNEHPTFSNTPVDGARYDSGCNCIQATDLGGDPIDPDDRNGHGTHVASIALGRGTSDGGPRGVAPGAHLVDVKISNDLGFSPNAIEKGIEWVIDYNDGETIYDGTPKIRAVVLSIVGNEPYTDRERNGEMEAIQKAMDNDIVVAVAAGNCGPESGDVSVSCSEGGSDKNTIPSPASAPEAITVGAVDDNDTVRRGEHEVTNYSSRGPNPAEDASDTTWRKPDVVAPGTDIEAACYAFSGDARGMDCEKTGTSMAAPHVAGLAAIVWQALEEAGRFEATGPNVKEIITSTATDWNATGWDHRTGYGYVDGYQAVVEATNQPPDSAFTFSPAEPEAGQQVTFDPGTSSDPDDNDRIERYRWTIDGEHVNRTRSQPLLDWTFDDTGNHTVELATVDSHGTVDPSPAVEHVQVVEPTAEETESSPPEVELSFAKTPVRVDQEVVLDASNTTDPDGDELESFAWDFDHGDTFSADRQTDTPTTNHTFEEAGPRKITVRVTDASGQTAQASLTIEIQPPKQGPPTVSITNPQEGDILAPGPVNLTWSVQDNPADEFFVSVNETAIDSTTNRFLEIDLREGKRTIAVRGTGPGGAHVDIVNVTVEDPESLDQASTDQEASSTEGAGSDDARPQPRDTTEDPTPPPGDEPAEPAGTNDSGDTNETPGPSLALALAALGLAGLLGVRRRR